MPRSTLATAFTTVPGQGHRKQVGLSLVTEHDLWETVNFASAGPSRSKVHLLVRHVRESVDFEIVPASESRFDKGPELHRSRPDRSWSLTDCLSFVVRTERGVVEALTGDHHFEQAGFKALPGSV